ncbi:hypothetical protein MGG_15561 [Pyricularia oryzae 70-15]|uniref:Uncharacterized protein n=1 Tax=Pyricularia oryzae (strain 70-15 / ATCC MYA-4617 / FGSC 8958) TaxID=242507 RepID=G4MTD0_PYRO7|nr:uncharacterized protein MGG_15561 [Pyricularia oryzae 70-15]EHA53876.1 hypothetical protein MGG_15561 [Pyricularia oryzae 70-15]
MDGWSSRAAFAREGVEALLRQIANAVMIFVADLKNLSFHLNVVVLVDTRQRVLDS